MIRLFVLFIFIVNLLNNDNLKQEAVTESAAFLQPLQLKRRLSGAGDASHRGQTARDVSGPDHPGGELVTVNEERGHSKAKWDLTLDKAARLQTTVAYGCEGGEGTEHRFV